MKQSGFSLIELLIVILILSITVLFATLTFGDFGQHKKTKMQALQFINHIELARQYAMVANSNVIVNIDTDNYHIKNNQNSKLKIFKRQYLKNILINESTDSISINSLGEISDFKLTLATKNSEHPMIIICSQDKITLNE